MSIPCPFKVIVTPVKENRVREVRSVECRYFSQEVVVFRVETASRFATPQSRGPRSVGVEGSYDTPHQPSEILNFTTNEESEEVRGHSTECWEICRLVWGGDHEFWVTMIRSAWTHPRSDRNDVLLTLSPDS